jgi:tetratricopeptide (TPR) repeat protein
MRSKPCIGAFVLITTLFVGSALGQGNVGSVRGRVLLPNDAPFYETASVRLESLRGVRSTAFTDNQGNFSFRSVPVGIYEVIVEADKNRFEPSSMRVEVFPNSPSVITIVLKSRKEDAELKPAGETVSTGELDPNIPSAAKKEFDLAADAATQKKSEEAVAHLQKAIDIYPQYLKAHNDLGAQLLIQGKLDEACESLARAIQLDPKAFNPHLNLGMVFVQQHKFSEASAELTKALALESNSASARLYYGLALVGLNDVEGAEKELKIAYNVGGTAYALALFHLGQLYMGKGEREAAVKTFETYLAVAPSATNAGEVKKMLALLKQ